MLHSKNGKCAGLILNYLCESDIFSAFNIFSICFNELDGRMCHDVHISMNKE